MVSGDADAPWSASADPAAPPIPPLVSTLPVESVVPDVREALRLSGCAVLVAPPSAGKTTLIPLALLDEDWLGRRKVLVLEPRRLAARAAATRMASLLGEQVGRRVGYRVRLESRVSADTRIEVVTEGILTRMLQRDPALEGVGIVIFDEFHERSLHSDLGLALTLQARSLLRPDLRLLVMSATLDAAPVASLMRDAPIIRSEGRSYSVEVRHRPQIEGRFLDNSILRVAEEALAERAGDVLVFLPGEGPIRRSEAALRSAVLPGNPIITPLFGSLPFDAQARALEPDPAGRRKIVLSTSIAETSLTIEGVTIVIDSGFSRVPRFSPRTGMQRLETIRVSRASAAQRAGRAGRLGPGICYRLWSEQAEREMVEHASPEILGADLTPILLELAMWGVRDPAELSWLNPPPEGALGHARELLTDLGALDSAGRITPHGRAMADLGVHPRLAHMLIRGAEEGLGAMAADLAALLSGRDVLPRSSHTGTDIVARLDALRGVGGDPGGVARVKAEAAQWRKRLNIPSSNYDPGDAGALLAYAYPERLGLRRAAGSNRYLLRNGRGALLPPHDRLSASHFLIVLDVDDAGTEGRIHLASGIREETVAETFEGAIREQTTAEWQDGRLRGRRERVLGSIILSSTSSAEVPLEAAVEAIRAAARREGIQILGMSDAARALQQRVAFCRAAGFDFPDLSDDSLLSNLDRWIAPLLGGGTTVSTSTRLDVGEALRARLDWKSISALDDLAPTHFTAPTGSRIPIDYTDVEAPSVSVKLQELFGLAATPLIAGGRVALTMKMLSPAQRPVQVTRDLESFWREGYFAVRKDLRGRYPKHDWPEDPTTAQPSRGVKRRT